MRKQVLVSVDRGETRVALLEATGQPDSLTKTSSIAEAYWFTHQQSRDGWTHELDLRPSVEKW